MAVRVRQVTRTTQPQEAVSVDWSNPITRSMRVLIDPYGRECVNGTMPTFSGATLGPGVGGTGIIVGGGNDDRAYWPIPQLSSAGTEITLEFLVSITAAPQLSTLGGVSPANSFTGAVGLGGETRAVLLYPGTPGDWYFWGNNNDHDSGVVTGTVGALAHYVVTKASGTGACQVTHYLNGVQIAQGNSNNTSAFALPSGGPYFIIGSRHFSAASAATLQVYKAAMWERVLSASEAASLYASQWQQFAPEQIVVKAGAAATNVTAAIAATQAADTSAVAGTVTDRASLASTQAADTSAIGSTVTNRATIAATQGADVPGIVGAVATPVTASIDVTQAADSSELIVFTPRQNVGGGIAKQRRRKIVVDGRLYEVPERDIPALLEAVMLKRTPPRSAEVVEERAERKDPAKAQKQPATATKRQEWVQPTVDTAQARYEAMLAEIEAQAQADVAQTMRRVAQRVMDDLNDEEEAAIALLMH